VSSATLAPGLACDFALTIQSVGLPSAPNPSGTVTASAVLEGACGLPSPMAGTYDTTTGQLVVSALDGTGVNYGLVGTTSDAGVITGSVESSGSGGGEYIGLFVPDGGSVLAFCGTLANGTLGIDPVISSDGTAVAVEFFDYNVFAFDDGTAADGGVTLMLPMSEQSFTLVDSDGGGSLTGAGYAPASGSPNGC
jgi:hypothetical protein